MELWNGNISGNNIPQNQCESSGGFTLLEVLIAITITGLVIAVLSNALIQNTQNQHLLQERQIALVLGRSKLSEIIYNSESGTFGIFDDPYKKFHWYASSENLPDGYAKITLSVEWRDVRARSHQTVLIGYSLPQ